MFNGNLKTLCPHSVLMLYIDSACRKCHIIEMGWSYAVLFFSSFFAAVGGTKGSGSSFFSDSVSSNTFPSTSVTSRHLTIYSYLVKFCEDSWWMIKATIFWDMFTILFLLTKLAERFVIVNLAMHAWFSSKKSTFFYVISKLWVAKKIRTHTRARTHARVRCACEIRFETCVRCACVRGL